MTGPYYLDLCRRFPRDEILPIALVDDDMPRALPDTVERRALGKLYFQFQTRIVQVPALTLAQFRHSTNRVFLSFSPNMAGTFDRIEQILRVVLEFFEQDDLAGFRRFFEFWVVEGRLTPNQQTTLHQRLKKMDRPIIMEWLEQEAIEKGMAKGLEKGLEKGIREGLEKGLEQGIRLKALEDARKLVGHGVAWEIITDTTGIGPEDLSNGIHQPHTPDSN